MLAKWTFFQTKQSMHDFIIAQSFYLKYYILHAAIYFVYRKPWFKYRNKTVSQPTAEVSCSPSSYCYRLINIGQCARNKFANSIWFPPIFECFAQVGENENYCVYSLEFYCIYKFMNLKKTHIDVLLNSVYKQNHHDIDIIQNITPSS